MIFADSARQFERLYAIFEDLVKKKGASRHVEFTSLVLSLHEGFVDYDLKLACYTDHQIFDRYHRFRIRRNYNRSEAITVRELSSLKTGDFVTHIDHGVGRFAGLEAIEVNGKPQEAVRLVYKDNDILYVSIPEHPGNRWSQHPQLSGEHATRAVARARSGRFTRRGSRQPRPRHGRGPRGSGGLPRDPIRVAGPGRGPEWDTGPAADPAGHGHATHATAAC